MSGDSDSALTNLTHHFLIAMPGLEDAIFGRSVVYVCEHSQRGALGLVINKRTDIDMNQLFEKIDLNLRRKDLQALPVLQGGPVQTDRGFVLHEAIELPGEKEGTSLYNSTLSIPGSGLEMTTSRDILEALSLGGGPKKVLITLGYSAWSDGQLETEISENSWLTVEADASVIFDTPIEQRYDKALSLLGLESWMLSAQAGHA